MAGNTQVIFKSRPVGWVGEEHFEIREVPVPEPGDGDVLVRNIYLSVDPYMRGRMRAGKSYAPGFELGQVLVGSAVGQVDKSNNPQYSTGDFVTGMLGWEHFTLVAGGAGLRPVDPGLAPLSHYLGVLGMPGMTAYVGLLDIGEPREGETVVVSAASGAVGQIVGQIAKLKGCRVIGSAGSDDKVAFITEELGFDSGFNYKTAASLGEALDGHCGGGIDVYFDNVGGAMLDAVLARINVGARLVECGMISQYNLVEPEGVANLMMLVGNRARMQGFIVSDHFDRLPGFIAEMAGWLRDGSVKYREDIVEGVENAPAAFIRMLRGENFGKQVVQLGDDPSRA